MNIDCRQLSSWKGHVNHLPKLQAQRALCNLVLLFIKWSYTPFKKSNATRLWSIIFLLSWIFIPQVWHPYKACLFAFRLMPYLLWLFHWGACRVSKLGVKSKRKCCKIDQIVWEMHVMPSFWLYARIHCPFIVPKSLAHWMGSGYPRVHSVTKGKRKTSHIACISHTIWSILQLLFLDVAPNLLTLHAPQWNNPNK